MNYFLVASIFCCVSCIISFKCIWLHLKHYRRPDLQRLIIRILWMVPIYSVTSTLSLYSQNAADYIDTLRDCYESFVIWTFFLLLMNLLDGEGHLLERLEDRVPTPHTFPLCCLPPLDMGHYQTFLSIKRGILQFVAIKPVLALLTMIMRTSHIYHEGDFSPASCWLWITFIYNISVCISMYCLVIFYVATVEDLKPHRPLAKLLCIKAVIFFSFWQGVVISLLVDLEWIVPADSTMTKSQFSVTLQDLLISIEMIFAALAHRYSFPHEAHSGLYSCRFPLGYAVRDAFGWSDIIGEAIMTWRGIDVRFEPLPQQENTNLLSNRENGRSGNYGSTHQNSRESKDQRLSQSIQRRLFRPFQRQWSYYRYIDHHPNLNPIPLTFPDIEDEQDVEEQYEVAKKLVGGDYNYVVIEPSLPTIQIESRKIEHSKENNERDLKSDSEESINNTNEDMLPLSDHSKTSSKLPSPVPHERLKGKEQVKQIDLNEKLYKEWDEPVEVDVDASDQRGSKQWKGLKPKGKEKSFKISHFVPVLDKNLELTTTTTKNQESPLTSPSINSMSSNITSTMSSPLPSDQSNSIRTLSKPLENQTSFNPWQPKSPSQGSQK